MLGTYYYHEIVRRTIIAFGTLFNEIDIKHQTAAGGAFSTVRVPIAYGPTEKFLARLEQKPDLRKRVAITLPRLAFEMDGISYDPSRKVSTMQTFKAFTKDGSKSARKVFMPVPYNLSFKLYAMTQYNEDSLQIIEQILPYFQPSFNLTVDLVKAIGEKRDIPMVLESVTFDDNYDSGYDQKRIITHTLSSLQKHTYLAQSQILVQDLLRKFRSIITQVQTLRLQLDLRDILLNQEHLKIIMMMQSLHLPKILQRHRRNSWYKILQV